MSIKHYLKLRVKRYVDFFSPEIQRFVRLIKFYSQILFKCISPIKVLVLLSTVLPLVGSINISGALEYFVISATCRPHCL